MSVSNYTRWIARLIKIVKNAEPQCAVLEATGLRADAVGNTER
jgi:hypothetical protein